MKDRYRAKRTFQGVHQMPWVKSLLAGGILLVGVSSLLAREWSDTSGSFHLQGDFVSLKDGQVKLRDGKGTAYKVPLLKLSRKDRAFVQGRDILDTFDEFKAFTKRVSRKAELKALYDGFSANPDASADDKKLAVEYREDLKKAAAALKRHDELLYDAFSHMRRHRYDAALLDLKRARMATPDSLEPDLAAGVFLATVQHDFKKAEGHFRQALARGKKNGSLTNESQRQDFFAALNNMALIRIRQGKTNAAYALWNQMLDVKAEAPIAAVNNVARARQLMLRGKNQVRSPIFLHVSEKSEKRFSDLSVNLSRRQGRLALDTRVGWLYMVGDGSVGLTTSIDEGIGGWNACEDRWCMACSGLQTRECPNGKCKNGTVRAFRYQTRVHIIGGRRVKVNEKIPYRKKCGSCSGRGKVPCNHCGSGKF